MAAIEARGLSRTYGGTVVVEGVDLDIDAGEVVGLLGLNGAGKTTTLRMLAGALSPTSGTARIGGVDVVTDPVGARRHLGYLPERPPLYDEMGVAEYVRHAARLRGVADVARAADEALERTGLGSVAHRIVGRLSKGFRQRVGLAQALVHRPSVLLLDEPASGLDPGQRVEIRSLVRELAEGQVTVVLSTHVLPEVEAICSRVVVLHAGRVVARDTLDALIGGRALRVVVRRPEGLASALARVDGVVAVREDGGALRVEATRDVRAEVASIAAGHELLELGSDRPLEEAFLGLTEVTP